MSLFVSSLNSGSNGNCYYIGNAEDAILVDAGLCCKEIEKRMMRLQLSISKLKAIFISHEHSDHIKGLSIFSRKHQLPVYITANTLLNGRIALEQHLVHSFSANEPVIIGSLRIMAFAKHHDACDPYSFIVSCNKVNVGVFTDIGQPCAGLKKYFKLCHAAFLEANYDEVMLQNGSYPYHLKRRITGGKGHLSNRQALEVFINCRAAGMSHLFLSHLSKNNNCPQLVQQLFEENANGVQIIVASRYSETAIYQIQASVENAAVVAPPVKQKAAQLAFAFL